MLAVGLLMWETAEPGQLLYGIAPNLVAAGIIGVLIFVLYGKLVRQRQQQRHSEQARTLQQILDVVGDPEGHSVFDDSKIIAAIDGGLSLLIPAHSAAQDLGLVACHRNRPTAEINDGVLNASNTVHILEISLHSMRDIAGHEWGACAAGDFRVILLDPHYPPSGPLALQRDREENQQEGKILDEVRTALDRFPDGWFGQDQDKTRVKLAQVMPTLSYFRIDDRAYVSPYLHDQVGDVTLHLELRQGGLFFEILEKHFDVLWKDRERTVRADPAHVSATYG